MGEGITPVISMWRGKTNLISCGNIPVMPSPAFTNKSGLMCHCTCHPEAMFKNNNSEAHVSLYLLPHLIAYDSRRRN